jgi:hypothetical protein
MSRLKRYGGGSGLLAIVGFLLSPLSWWNGIFVNVPLAYIVAWPIGKIHSEAFLPAFGIAYFGTNVLGMILMQKGIGKMAKGDLHKYTRKNFIKDLKISLAYTIALVVLVKIGLVDTNIVPPGFIPR